MMFWATALGVSGRKRIIRRWQAIAGRQAILLHDGVSMDDRSGRQADEAGKPDGELRDPCVLAGMSFHAVARTRNGSASDRVSNTFEAD